MTTTPEPTFDALLPPAMAVKAEQVGVNKANLEPINTFLLAMLAGAFIALGAVFSTTVTAGASGVIPFGVTKLLGGMVFCLGLILVVVAGAELFTGNNLIVMAWASGKVTTAQLLKNWIIVYLGNLVGSIATALLMFFSGQYAFGSGIIGLNVLTIANAKANLDFAQAIVLGILCNALVCLAVWLTYSARTTTDKILAVLFPITAFVAAGFEHSVANMYFIPIGLLVKGGAPAEFWNQIGKTAADYSGLTWQGFLINNLIPVTIGNIIGGTMLVGVIYWRIYSRQRQHASKNAQTQPSFSGD
jgi:formate transporter